MSGTKNIMVMGAAMMAMKSIDQEDPDVIMYARLAFSAYVLISLAINILLHLRVTTANDLTVITVPPAPASPFAPPPPEPKPNANGTAEGASEPKDKQTTILAYDLSLLQAARKSFMMNAVILTLIHMKTSAVSPLLMSSIMGMTRLFDEPLFKLHMLGFPSAGQLKRPFPPEPNPLANLLQGLVPKLPADESATPSTSAPAPAGRIAARNQQFPAAYVEDVHDDDDDDDDDDDPAPAPVADRDDDNDFESESADEPKKSK